MNQLNNYQPINYISSINYPITQSSRNRKGGDPWEIDEATLEQICLNAKERKLILDNIFSKLHAISNRKFDWDDNRSAAIKANSLQNAEKIIPNMFECILQHYNYRTQNGWIEPYISSDEDGDVTLRWSIGNKRLYMVISDDSINYLKVSGNDINAEMIDGFMNINESLNNSDKHAKVYTELWKWLTHK